MAAVRGDRTYCGFETDVEEACGETPVVRVTGVFLQPKLLSVRSGRVQIDAYLCQEHRVQVMGTPGTASLTEVKL